METGKNNGSATGPAVSVEEITDAATAGSGIELINQDVVKLQPGDLHARRIVVHLESAHAIFHSTNSRLRTRTTVMDGLLAFVVFGPRANGTINGLPVRPGMLLAADSTSEACLVVGQDCWESMTFLLPPQLVSKHLAARQRESEFCFPRGVEILQADPAKVDQLFDWGKRLTATAARQPEIFDAHSISRKASQVEMLETLFSAIDVAERSEPSRSERTRQTYGQMVKRAEEYALEHAGDQLYVSDLCRIAEVSERTLEYAFQEIFGFAPMTYLIRLRLHRVRQSLLAATQGTTTVSIEALLWGFWHFGEFSHLYKDCFGELPSHTLRRKPDAPENLH
jgi:AraC family ethanolamine operon transcriptional activator